MGVFEEFSDSTILQQQNPRMIEQNFNLGAQASVQLKGLTRVKPN